jgi:uncharacterized protein YydD (DUF2326 family)
VIVESPCEYLDDTILLLQADIRVSEFVDGEKSQRHEEGARLSRAGDKFSELLLLDVNITLHYFDFNIISITMKLTLLSVIASRNPPGGYGGKVGTITFNWKC